MKEQYKYWFACLSSLTGTTKRKLMELFGTEEEIYRLAEGGEEVLKNLPGKVGPILTAHRKEHQLEKLYEEFLKKDISLISYKDMEYPRKLHHIYNPPYALFIKGKIPVFEKKMVSLVGARGCSSYGQGVAESIAADLVKFDVGIVSGMANGIDTAAHIGALKKGGKTYAVMGCGVDICYPASNMQLYRKILEKGSIISEYPPGCEPRKHHFPMRNRIISGLSEAVIVVEARKKSGSLITAECALEQGKLVYAVPGRICDDLSYGTNWLLSQGAAPFYAIDEFLKDLNIDCKAEVQNKKNPRNLLEKKQALLYSCMDLSPKHLEDILVETGLDFTEAARNLLELQQQGFVREIYKNYYVRTDL